MAYRVTSKHQNNIDAFTERNKVYNSLKKSLKYPAKQAMKQKTPSANRMVEKYFEWATLGRRTREIFRIRNVAVDGVLGQLHLAWAFQDRIENVSVVWKMSQ